MNQLFASVDSIILGFVQGSFGSLTAGIYTLWRLMFIVFIALYGYKIIISGRFSTSDLIASCLRIIVLLMLATQWNMFFLFVYRMVTDMPSDISGQIMAAASTSLGAQSQAASPASANVILSQFYDRVLVVVDKLLEGAGWNHFGPYLYAFAVWVGGICFTGYAAMLIILSKLAVAVILAVGPIFILLLIFKDTRQLFEGWLRTLLNFAFIPVFVYATLALLLAIAEPSLQYLEKNTSVYDQLITAIGPFLITMFIATLLLKQILNISASITGGMSLSTMGSAAGLVTGLRYFGESSALLSAGAWKQAKAGKAYAGKKYETGKTALKQYLEKNRRTI